MTSKFNYISELDQTTQEEIKEELKQAILELGFYNEEEIKEEIQNGMDSTLIDLEDTININKYL